MCRQETLPSSLRDWNRACSTVYLEECHLLSQTRHPNIVQFLGVCFEEGSQFPILVMEFLPTNSNIETDPPSSESNDGDPWYPSVHAPRSDGCQPPLQHQCGCVLLWDHDDSHLHSRVATTKYRPHQNRSC